MGVAKPQIVLLPWDHESTKHVERLYQQRIACGWNKEAVEEWRDLQRTGKIALHWVVLTETDPSSIFKLTTHTTAWPAESTPISDSCSSFGGEPRVPSPSRKFIPVGHISLDFENEDPNAADRSRGICRISSFYISTALQSAGLGGAAMDEIERLATDEPLNARTLTLGTSANEYVGRKEKWDALKADGKVEPKACKPLGWDVEFSNQDWYARRGYEVYGRRDKMWSETDSKGRLWWTSQILMRKDIK